MSMSVAIVPTARPGKTGKIVAAHEASNLGWKGPDKYVATVPQVCPPYPRMRTSESRTVMSVKGQWRAPQLAAFFHFESEYRGP